MGIGGRRQKTADWEPGTLEKTRKAIGEIEPLEAEFMAKKLGGEVMYERSESSEQGSSQARTPKRPAAISSSRGASSSSSSAKSKSGGTMSNQTQTQSTQVYRRRIKNDLPPVPPRFAAEIDKLMMSSEYKIKPNYGFFNFIRKFQKNGTEKIIPEFYEITLKNYIDNIESFITVIKTMIQVAPSTYKSKIANGTDSKFKFLRMVAGWTMQSIRLAYIELQDIQEPLLVADLIPLIKSIYRPLMSIYYYGDTKIPKLIKEIYADEVAYADAPKEKLSSLAKEAITQWLYLNTEVIHKLYPLLMRMCSDSYEVYPTFFSTRIADILQFIGLHKFDLLLPEKQKEEIKEKPAEKPVVREVRGKYDEIVKTGIDLLERLFPQAGFKNLDSRPDLFPYFQPLYEFEDGFNVLSPANPLQVTVVLLRILEDFFQGCRNIEFVVSEKQNAGAIQADTILRVLDDWSAYRETLFENMYCKPLVNLVNSAYSQPGYEKSAYGKKTISSLLWQTKFHFFPSFKFTQLLLERPSDDSKYPHLSTRTDFVRKYLSSIIVECDSVRATRGVVQGVKNPWAHYKFDIPNEISKRLDVLLGAQNTSETTNANNANLLKYTLCIMSVLDWWINNESSPAYSADPMNIYRISREDGKPEFSVPERTDQNKLFADAIKAAYQKK
ncbi:MAG: hypothetical protein IKI31_06610 [Treponema sp.]|nr:hypothetical protein [Treponema sp.]